MKHFRFFTTAIFNIAIIIPVLYMAITESSKLALDSEYARLEGIFAGGFYIAGLIFQLVAFIPTLIMIIIYFTKKDDGIIAVIFSIIGTVVSAFISLIAIVPITLVETGDDQGWLVLLFFATVPVIIINVIYLINIIVKRAKNKSEL